MLTNVALIALMLATSGISAPAQSDSRTVIEKFFTAYRARDVESLIAVMSPTVKFEDPTARVHAEGHQGIRRMAEQLRAAYSDLTVDVHSMIVSGDDVAAEITVSGTVTRADGAKRKINVRGASFFRVKDGRVEKWTDYFDVNTMNEQIKKPD